MKNFHHAKSNKIMPVRLISAYWAQKTFDSYFVAMVLVEFMKNFHLAHLNEVIAVRLIGPIEPKNVRFLHSRPVLRRFHEKILTRWFDIDYGC